MARPAGTSPGMKIVTNISRGTVDGRPVQMLVDMDNSAGVVRGAKLDAANKVPVLCVHEDACSYPTAEVELVSGTWRKKVRVAVAPNLPVAVLLGRDAYSEAGEEEVGCSDTLSVQESRREMKERGDAREIGEVMADLSPLSEV